MRMNDRSRSSCFKNGGSLGDRGNGYSTTFYMRSVFTENEILRSV